MTSGDWFIARPRVWVTRPLADVHVLPEPERGVL